MELLAKRRVYKVTENSPRLLSSTNGTVSTKHLVVIHDISSCEHEIEGNVAKLSLYNLKDVTLTLNGRILSSLLEISHCTNVTINFRTAAPAITQLDPEINNLKFLFATGFDPGAFVIAPRSLSAQDWGLAQISAELAGRVFVFVDEEGRVDTELMLSAEGSVSEQYKIEMIKDGERGRWRMEGIKNDGKMPLLNANRL